MEKPVARPPSYRTVSSEKHWARRRDSKFPEIEALIPRLQAAADYFNEREQTLPEKHPQTQKSTELFFDSAAEAMYANLDTIDHWAPPKSNPSIPTTHAEKVALIKELVSAIMNTDNCLTTNSDDAAYQERWGPNSTFYHASQIEVVAWRLLQLMIDIHQRGWSVTLSDPKQRDDVCLSMKFTFSERMNILLKVLRISKSTCEALIKGNRFAELVGCPHVVFERVHGNNSSNAGRSQSKEAVAARKKRGTSAENAEEPATHPAKKQKKASTADKSQAASRVKPAVNRKRKTQTMRGDVSERSVGHDVSRSIAQSVFEGSFADSVRSAVFAPGVFAGFRDPAQ